MYVIVKVVLWSVLIDKNNFKQLLDVGQYCITMISDVNKLIQLSVYDNATDVSVVKWHNECTT